MFGGGKRSLGVAFPKGCHVFLKGGLQSVGGGGKATGHSELLLIVESIQHGLGAVGHIPTGHNQICPSCLSLRLVAFDYLRRQSIFCISSLIDLLHAPFLQSPKSFDMRGLCVEIRQ